MVGVHVCVICKICKQSYKGVWYFFLKKETNALEINYNHVYYENDAVKQWKVANTMNTYAKLSHPNNLVCTKYYTNH